MHAPNHGVTRRHFLLPFEAEPQAVGRLRCAVGLQLTTWGFSDVADAALLAVSELATNVIRHVGAGTPAALVMEAKGDTVRVELHDTSGCLPHREQAGPDDETGRGLSLVAAVSGGWSATATPGGKAVCCEFAATPTRRTEPHGYRVDRASEVINRYVLGSDSLPTRPLGSLAAMKGLTADLITDLLHWLAANGHDPDTVLDYAQTRFEAEAMERVR
jgi:anti-sigma regulatory factor (Ser/Thr protein kinase)